MPRGQRADGTRYVPSKLGGRIPRVTAPANPPPLEQALASLSRSATKTMLLGQRYFDQHERWPENAVLRDMLNRKATHGIGDNMRELTRAGFITPLKGKGMQILRRVPDEVQAPEAAEEPVGEVRDAAYYEALLNILERASRPFAKAANRLGETSNASVPIFTIRDGVTGQAMRELAAAHAVVAEALRPAPKKGETREAPIVWNSSGPISDDEIRALNAEARGV